MSRQEELTGSLEVVLEFGNSAMLTRSDAARALRVLADRLERREDGTKIRDVNGNTVGRYEFKR